MTSEDECTSCTTIYSQYIFGCGYGLGMKNCIYYDLSGISDVQHMCDISYEIVVVVDREDGTRSFIQLSL